MSIPSESGPGSVVQRARVRAFKYLLNDRLPTRSAFSPAAAHKAGGYTWDKWHKDITVLNINLNQNEKEKALWEIYDYKLLRM